MGPGLSTSSDVCSHAGPLISLTSRLPAVSVTSPTSPESFQSANVPPAASSAASSAVPAKIGSRRLVCMSVFSLCFMAFLLAPFADEAGPERKDAVADQRGAHDRHEGGAVCSGELAHVPDVGHVVHDLADYLFVLNGLVLGAVRIALGDVLGSALAHLHADDPVRDERGVIGFGHKCDDVTDGVVILGHRHDDVAGRVRGLHRAR